MTEHTIHANEIVGDFVTLNNQPYYAIYNVDQMPPFFVSVVSDDDHWLFASSTGGLTAGRISPETALFPYVPVDQIHESSLNTGSKTLVRVTTPAGEQLWQPYNQAQDLRYSVSRNLYKSTLGNTLCFEEVNHDLQLTFRYTWEFSATYGFIRRCELVNLSEQPVTLKLLDGLQNILPAGTPRYTQTQSSNLVDAYKWSELDTSTGLALFTLYSGITDRAEPSESLRANTVFCLGIPSPTIILSSEQVNAFIHNGKLSQEIHKRGMRGAYLVGAECTIERGKQQNWQIVANVEQTQKQVVTLNQALAHSTTLARHIELSVQKGSDELARIIGASDGYQATNEPLVSAHHYANTLFNVLRGGIFDDQYRIDTSDFVDTLKRFNKTVFERHRIALKSLPETLHMSALITFAREQRDSQLERLTFEYLPITFGRRHGDPSRPWNQFELRFKDEQGHRILSYQGNWRDIFQNWEALLFSYPLYIEQVIAKFVNASTVDGYNPYRITKQGIDWEVEEPDDPWSYIGYWGDHQIIYLLKLLEQSEQFHPGQLHDLLNREMFSFANVPYKIKPFDALLDNAKDTVVYDTALASLIEDRVAAIGRDGKLVLDDQGAVYQVNLLEKLLVTLLCKLGNFVLGGGIWLNTQRPEWNDANNALVGQGLSMVTLYYTRRYVTFMQTLLSSSKDNNALLSIEVADWLTQTMSALEKASLQLPSADLLDVAHPLLVELGRASSDYRTTVYEQGGYSGKVSINYIQVNELLDHTLSLLDVSIRFNLRKDGLYHAYNLLGADKQKLGVSYLYPMLEGQVAALNSGALSAVEACQVLDALFDSDIYRRDQNTFMLYPDRDLPSFLDKNKVPGDAVDQNPLLSTMVRLGDERVVGRDDLGCYRFHPDLKNVGDLTLLLDQLHSEYGEIAESTRHDISRIYEDVFNHRSFTGRSGGMFGFEGLGCIYWHMVSKLLLAAQEQFFAALNEGSDASIIQKLGEHYYAIRHGIGFNKTPQEYGAFPCDPYSHTPKHAGAQQPGMTGQVKEEVLTRFGELGIQVLNGSVTVNPRLLRRQEFNTQPTVFRYLDVKGQWQTIDVPADSLAFTWCQVPFVYSVSAEADMSVSIVQSYGEKKTLTGNTIGQRYSQRLFERTGDISNISIRIPSDWLFVA